MLLLYGRVEVVSNERGTQNVPLDVHDVFASIVHLAHFFATGVMNHTHQSAMFQSKASSAGFGVLFWIVPVLTLIVGHR